MSSPYNALIEPDTPNELLSGHQVYNPVDFAPAATVAEPIVRQSTVNPDEKYSVFSFEYYQRFLDLDTSDVIQRTLVAMNPFGPRRSFVNLMSRDSDCPRPDLYGPLWISATLVFILFFSSTLLNLIQAGGQGSFVYDFSLLTAAAAIIYGYTIVVPIGLWLLLAYYLGIHGLRVDGDPRSHIRGLWGLVCIYGYAAATWIPICLINVLVGSILVGLGVGDLANNILRWTLVAIGAIWSGVFIAKAFLGAIWDGQLASSPDPAKARKSVYMIGAGVAVLHLALAIAVKVSFFSGNKLGDIGV
ncbi:Yip1-domain-containing protein [Nadsonia fulvescens var. elongata DSM 6958]|uniref:Protein YIP n=1 Tax=Nadsonia fulvescens var. elongata DSM 6958 TaxID=857566 RepID=A0A1E3PIT2_9ASCO|nr:Yip1-domain-containing protein [Nadsonia fulvescens var. elongata DSM 6958]